MVILMSIQLRLSQFSWYNGYYYLFITLQDRYQEHPSNLQRQKLTAQPTIYRLQPNLLNK